ncbi:unnamed protein product [Brassica napus]|uniref:(rape) hypothetical protein n=1 Tax=Brassica napus TaxID=3708 RepID=A0A816JY23_BRANA|nr:unnamed protein product [Brassica napus]
MVNMTWNKMIIIHHTCLAHFQHTEKDEATNDDIHLGGTDEYSRTSYPSVNLNLSASDEEAPRLSRSPVRSAREVSRHSPYAARNSSSGVRSTSSTRRAHTRRSNFEAQTNGRFQQMEESRGQLLYVVRSRGGGSVGGGSNGGESVGDQGFSLGDINEDDYDGMGNTLLSQAARGFNSQTSHNFGSFDSGSHDINPHRFPGSSSGNFPEMFNFFNKNWGNDEQN